MVNGHLLPSRPRESPKAPTPPLRRPNRRADMQEDRPLTGPRVRSAAQNFQSPSQTKLDWGHHTPGRAPREVLRPMEFLRRASKEAPDDHLDP